MSRSAPEAKSNTRFILTAFLALPIASAALTPHFLVGRELRHFEAQKAAATAKLSADQLKRTTLLKSFGGKACTETIDTFLDGNALQEVPTDAAALLVKDTGKCDFDHTTALQAVTKARDITESISSYQATIANDKERFKREQNNELWQEVGTPLFICGFELAGVIVVDYIRY